MTRKDREKGKKEGRGPRGKRDRKSRRKTEKVDSDTLIQGTGKFDPPERPWALGRGIPQS